MIPVVDVRCSDDNILVTLADTTEYTVTKHSITDHGTRQPKYMRNSLRSRVRAFSRRDLPVHKLCACSFALSRLNSVNS